MKETPSINPITSEIAGYWWFTIKANCCIFSGDGNVTFALA
jgi:hypothetical protein